MHIEPDAKDLMVEGDNRSSSLEKKGSDAER